MTRGAYAVIALALVLAIIFLFGDRPATSHPLLVDASLTNGKGPSVVCVPVFPPQVKPVRWSEA